MLLQLCKNLNFHELLYFRRAAIATENNSTGRLLIREIGLEVYYNLRVGINGLASRLFSPIFQNFKQVGRANDSGIADRYTPPYEFDRSRQRKAEGTN